MKQGSVSSAKPSSFHLCSAKHDGIYSHKDTVRELFATDLKNSMKLEGLHEKRFHIPFSDCRNWKIPYDDRLAVKKMKETTANPQLTTSICIHQDNSVGSCLGKPGGKVRSSFVVLISDY
ncbi:hypothetical protein C5167_021041 [Papaver somniferum]|uniref:Uncharacterized protein n=1 Tax=Papaver somniferum TaxID=3469 RepID=A0A4Y7IYP0_PAPSO|nr:hypothetical protein C5167_021041 [Papaver somniferum]